MKSGTLLCLASSFADDNLLTVFKTFQHPVGMLFDTSCVSQEIMDELVEKIKLVEKQALPEVTGQILSVVSFFNTNKTKELMAKVDDFFNQKYELFHQSLILISKDTDLSQHQILQYFYDKFTDKKFVTNPNLEKSVQRKGLRVLVNFEDELLNITQAETLHQKLINDYKLRLTQMLEESLLQQDLLFSCMDKIGLD